MNVVVAGPERWEIVEKLVLALLKELGDEGEAFELHPRVRVAWEERPERMRALIAYGDGGDPLGVLTLTEGFAMYANGAYGIISEMYVVPGARSSGVGRRLIERAMDVGRERGWSRIDVTGPTSPVWDRTIRFYENCGFAFTGPKLKRVL